MATISGICIVHSYHGFPTNNSLSKLRMWHQKNPSPTPTSSYT